MKYKLLRNIYTYDCEDMAEDIDFQIKRQVYQQKFLYKITDYKKTRSSFRKFLKKHCECICLKVLYNTIPVVKWLPTYPWKLHFVADLISGITIGIITLPQAMAYAMLANIPPVAGLYMAVFPVIMYFMFSTSRHNSMGTFAVVCLMTGRTVADLAVTHPSYSALEVGASLAFLVGLMQLGMFLLRLGIIANIFSDAMVNGFTCGAACHVVNSQLPSLLGLTVTKPMGYFQVPKKLYLYVLALKNANTLTITMSFLAILVMVLNNELLKPWLAKHTRIPVPIELIVVICGTLVGYFGNLNKLHDVDIVAHIPTGVPAPKLPSFALFPVLTLDSFLITVVSYCISISMALLFAQKGRYKVKPNQELFAMGASNVFGSFFSCAPVCSSVSRTYILYHTGGKTQIASVIAAAIILIILFLMGPLFESLPKCFLSAIIVVALKGMLHQARQFPQYLRLSYWDCAIWITAFLPTVLVSISMGLLCGVVTSMLSLFIHGHQPYTCVLAHLPGTELYLDPEQHSGLEEITGIKIFHYCGSLNFASRTYFKRILYEAAMLKPSKMKRYILNAFAEDDHDHIMKERVQLKCLILDFSALRYIDSAGVELLSSLVKEYAEVYVDVFMSGCSNVVHEKIKRCQKTTRDTFPLMFFVTIHDAVLYAKKYVLLTQ